jgi:hypothetical protein
VTIPVPEVPAVPDEPPAPELHAPEAAPGVITKRAERARI